LAALAGRILDNLDMIDAMAPAWDSADRDKPPFADTQLLISLLGVLVFPQEQVPEALGNLMRGYRPLGDVLTVVYPRAGEEIEFEDVDGEPVVMDPTLVANLPRLLRNSVAHFNMLPRASDGRFTGVRVWNRPRDGRITFVADIDFDELRRLARHVLTALKDQHDGLELRDPADPMDEVREYGEEPSPAPKIPKINGDIWRPFVEAHGGDPGAAKTSLDRWMKREAPVDRDIFLKATLATAHITEYGMCARDWLSNPCVRHGACSACEKQLILKGDPEHRQAIARTLRENQILLARATAEAEDGQRGAGNHARHLKREVAALEATMAIHDDPAIADGTYVQLDLPAL
jgi:hypothetical protein